MLRFEASFRVGVLNHEIALVLHHASIWSQLHGVDLVVHPAYDGARAEDATPSRDHALALVAEGQLLADAVRLYSYLAWILPAKLDVFVDKDRVRVWYDPHRRPAWPLPAFAQPPAT